MPDYQFSFKQKHSTMVSKSTGTLITVFYRTSIIENALKKKETCPSIFLDAVQIFDKVWHEGLLWKLQRDLLKKYYEILKSNMTVRNVLVKHVCEYFELTKISGGIP